MDELERLRALRSDEGVPDPTAQARVRGRVMAHAADGCAGSRTRKRRRPAKRTVLVAAVAGAAVAIAAITGLDDADVAPASASAALERAAAAAELHSPESLQPGQFFYLRDRSQYNRPPEVRETWTGRDGRGSFRVLSEGRPFPGRRDAEGWTSQDTGTSGFHFGQQKLTYDELRALPRDPRELHDRLVEAAGDAGPSPEAEAFVIVADTLRTLPVPADVRAALFRATKLIDGVRLVGAVRDPLGRDGIAIEHAGLGQGLVFDPRTSVVLAERLGATMNRVVEAQGIVDGQRDRPGDRPDAPPVPAEGAAACTRDAMGKEVNADMASVRCEDGVGLSVVADAPTVFAWKRDRFGRWEALRSASRERCAQELNDVAEAREAARLCP